MTDGPRRDRSTEKKTEIGPLDFDFEAVNQALAKPPAQDRGAAVTTWRLNLAGARGPTPRSGSFRVDLKGGARLVNRLARAAGARPTIDRESSGLGTHDLLGTIGAGETRNV